MEQPFGLLVKRRIDEDFRRFLPVVFALARSPKEKNISAG
jgi:hypothetical protein